MKFICGSIVIAAFLLASPSQATSVDACLSGGDLPKDLRIIGCHKPPCTFVKGTNVTAEWDFVVGEDTKHLKPLVRGKALGITMVLPFPQKDACEGLTNAKCPLRKGEEVTYLLNLPVLESYPEMSFLLEFAFLGDDGKRLVCFEFTAKVTAAAPRPPSEFDAAIPSTE